MKLSKQTCAKGLVKLQRNSAREELTASSVYKNAVKLQADWNRHYAAPTETYKYLCVGMLKCSKYLLSSKAKKLLYFGRIHSNLCYSLCIWGLMLQSCMVRKLAMAQEKAIRLIDPNLNLDELFTKHKILHFIDMVKVEQCKLGYKLCHGLLPNALVKNMK